MAEIITLQKPEAGQTVSVSAVKESPFALEFTQEDAALDRQGADLVFGFADGSTIVVQGFYNEVTKEALPDFIIDGQTVAGADFFAALSDNLQPAAGPDARGPEATGSAQELGTASLLGGIDRLGSLGVGGSSTGEASDQQQTAAGVAGSASPLPVGDSGAVEPAGAAVQPVAPSVDYRGVVTLEAGAPVAEGGAMRLTASVDNAPLSDLTLTLSNGAIITIAAGATSGFVDVATRVDDAYVQGPESTTVSITGQSGGGYTQLSAGATADYTVTDNTTPASVALSSTGFDAQGRLTVTASVDQPPLGDMDLVLNNGARITIRAGESQGSVTLENLPVGHYSSGAETLDIRVATVTGGGYENLAYANATLGSRLETISEGTGGTYASETHGDAQINALAPGQTLQAQTVQTGETGATIVFQTFMGTGANADNVRLDSLTQTAGPTTLTNVTTGTTYTANLGSDGLRLGDGNDTLTVTNLPGAGATPLTVAGGDGHDVFMYQQSGVSMELTEPDAGKGGKVKVNNSTLESTSQFEGIGNLGGNNITMRGNSGDNTLLINGALTNSVVQGDASLLTAGEQGGNDTLLINGKLTNSVVQGDASLLKAGEQGGNDVIRINADGTAKGTVVSGSGIFGEEILRGATGGHDRIEITGDVSAGIIVSGEEAPQTDLKFFETQNEKTGIAGEKSLFEGAVGGNDTITITGNLLSGEVDGEHYLNASTGGNDVITVTGQMNGGYVAGEGHLANGSQGGDDVITVGKLASGGIVGEYDLLNSNGGNDAITVNTMTGGYIAGEYMLRAGGVGGADTIHVNSMSGSNSTIYGDGTSAEATAVAGNDHISVETMSGGAIYGDAKTMTTGSVGGNDVIHVGEFSGTATMIVNGGSNTGNGSDLFVYGHGAEGSDGHKLTLWDNGSVTIQGVGNNVSITQFEGIGGGGGHDTLYGNNGNNILDGGAGNDYLDGGAGNDSLFGGAGDDLIKFDANDALIDGGNGLDVLLGGQNSLAAMESLIANKQIQGVEVLVSGGNDLAGLTNMDKLFETLNIAREDGGLAFGEGWTKDAEKLIGDTAYEVYHNGAEGPDLVTIMVQAEVTH